MGGIVHVTEMETLGFRIPPEGDNYLYFPLASWVCIQISMNKKYIQHMDLSRGAK